MEEKIMAIISDICGAGSGELAADTDLFETGLIDSFGVVQLLVKLEEELGVSLDIENLRRDEASTPAQIIRLAGRAP